MLRDNGAASGSLGALLGRPGPGLGRQHPAAGRLQARGRGVRPLGIDAVLLVVQQALVTVTRRLGVVHRLLVRLAPLLGSGDGRLQVGATLNVHPTGDGPSVELLLDAVGVLLVVIAGPLFAVGDRLGQLGDGLVAVELVLSLARLTTRGVLVHGSLGSAVRRYRSSMGAGWPNR